MLALIKHRGPDQAGYYVDDRLAMGAARLSIIDLQAGDQPLGSHDGRYWICYNGEVYNYRELRQELQAQGCRFRTASDTEVVLQAWIQWREACFARFNGAFAFAIYDSSEASLVLARDRYGKRPLFYTMRDGQLMFASEMKAFLALPIDFAFDPAQLATLFTTWAPLPHQTGFKGIEQLPMGEYLVVMRDQHRRAAYTQLDFKAQPAPATEAEAVEQIRETLRRSVELRLRSDVAVGVYLSGGLDSAIVTSLVHEISRQPVRTFSLEFADQEFDESAEQRQLVEQLGTLHSALRVSGREIAEHFPQAIFHAEIPAFRTAFVPMFLLSKMVREQGIKVIMSGEGADEAFLGYGIFKDTLLLTDWKMIDAAEKKAKLSRLYPYLGHFAAEEQQTHLMGLYQQFSVERNPGLLSHEMRFQNGRFSCRLLREPADPLAQILNWIAAVPGYAGFSPVQKAQWLEFKTLLAGYLLSTQGERMGLAHSVENRCPFLDPQVVALASALNLKFDDGFNEKYLLKQAFRDRLPAAVIAKGKFPYRAPDSAAFVTYQPDYQDWLLADSTLNAIDCINPAFARALVKKIFAARPEQISTKENQTFIFLISLVWLQHYFVQRAGLTTMHDQPLDPGAFRVIDRRSNRLAVV